MKLRAEIHTESKSFKMVPLRVLRPIMNLWIDSGSKFLASVHRRWAAARQRTAVGVRRGCYAPN